MRVSSTRCSTSISKYNKLTALLNVLTCRRRKKTYKLELPNAHLFELELQSIALHASAVNTKNTHQFIIIIIREIKVSNSNAHTFIVYA